MRDAAASLIHTKAKRRGFDMDCAHFFMGHTSQLDPNKYDKFFRDKEYAIEQDRIAEPYLNILSGKQEPVEITEELALKVMQNAPLVLRVLKLMEERNIRARDENTK
jgi:hypothetical protein